MSEVVVSGRSSFGEVVSAYIALMKPRVIELLPADLTTSMEQLRALAAKTSDLEIRGPMIRRKP